MSDLQIAKDFALPPSIAVHRLAWLGTTNSGKTYAASRCAELMWEAGIQFAALDSMGLWWAMRLRADGSPGFPITIFGGKHGDFNIRPEDGALIADVIHEERISAIIDISEFEHDSEKARFAHRFAERLYWRRKDKPGAIHLFLEEAHEYIPQNPQTGEADMLHVFNRLWKQGGNFGIGGSIVSQRPQDVAKKSLNLSAVVFAFNTVGFHEQDALSKWLKGVPELERLPSLQPGECLVYSPSLMGVKMFTRISEKITFHARFDPDAILSEVDVQNRSLAPVVVEALRDRFGKVNLDPLDVGEAARCSHLPAAKPNVGRKGVEAGSSFVPGPPAPPSVQTSGQTKALTDRNVELLDLLAKNTTTFSSSREALRLALDTAQLLVGGLETLMGILSAVPILPERVPLEEPEPIESDPATTWSKARFSLSANDHLALAAIGSFPNGIEPRHLAAYLGILPTTGHFNSVLKKLRDSGLILDKPLRLADPSMAPDQAPTKTLAEVQQSWVRKIKVIETRSGELIDLLLQAENHRLTTSAIAEVFGIKPTTGHFGKLLAELRNKGITREERHGGEKHVILTDFLFPEGLN